MSVLNNRKLAFFRCHIDPSIGPNPRLAYSVSDPLLQAIDLELELTNVGVYAKWVDKRNQNTVHEHLVPFANIQAIKLEPKSEPAEKQPDGVVEIKRGPGRPRKEEV